MNRQDWLVISGGIVPLAALPLGSAWIALIGAAVGWGLIAFAAPRAEAPARNALLGGAVAGLIALVTDYYFGKFEFLFLVRREFPGLPISPGMTATRAALFAGILYLYVRAKPRIGIALSIAAATATALVAGALFDDFGNRSGLWLWNARHAPDRQIGKASAFVPLAWGMTFLFSWYFLLPFQRRLPPWVAPFGIGARCGAAHLGFMLTAYLALTRLVGKGAF